MAQRGSIVVILAIIACLYLGTATKFTFQLPAYGKQCFSELLTEATPFHFRVDSETSTFDISLNHHDGTPLVINRRPEKTKKIDSYASITGEYFFCIIETGGMINSYNFNFYQGLELSDLASLPKQEDSKLIDEIVDRINEVYQKVTEQEGYSQKVNEYNMELQKLVSFKSVGFVFLSITVVFIISFLHYLEIKRVLKNRKII